jgi:opacity protein-like surface antigen
MADQHFFSPEVRMRTCVTVLVSALLVLAAAEARAQQWWPDWKPFDSKLRVAVNFGFQVGDNDLERLSTFELYDETAEVLTIQDAGGGPFFDIGASYPIPDVHPNFGVGMAYSFLSSSGDARISGSLPHPESADSPRLFTAEASDLSHSQHAFHFQAVWYVPFTDKVDFTIFGGPSIFNVKQDLVRGVQFTDVPPDFNTVTIDSVDVVSLSKTAFGLNLGADMIYALTDNIGAGVMLRYTYAGVDFDLSEGQTAELNAGGFQFAGGIRMKF